MYLSCRMCCSVKPVQQEALIPRAFKQSLQAGPEPCSLVISEPRSELTEKLGNEQGYRAASHVAAEKATSMCRKESFPAMQGCCWGYATVLYKHARVAAACFQAPVEIHAP